MTFATLISQHKAACFNVFSKKCLLWKILFGKLWSETESIYLSGFNYKVDSLGKDRKGWSRQTHWSPTPACVKKHTQRIHSTWKAKQRKARKKHIIFLCVWVSSRARKWGRENASVCVWAIAKAKTWKWGKSRDPLTRCTLEVGSTVAVSYPRFQVHFMAATKADGWAEGLKRTCTYFTK